MGLKMYQVYQTPDKDLNIIVRNHHDKVMEFCCPNDAASIDCRGRTLYGWSECTEINITSVYGRTATVQLEDDSDYGLIVSGNIEGGRKRVVVGGSRDFDVVFTGDGHMRLDCRDGYEWGSGLGKSLDYVLVPFQK